ncbi:MAG: YaiI/YqxD family protein [Victivallaceae bacterium]|nr:YaiI/YqxD family protein [Victivallaceae bacterium]
MKIYVDADALPAPLREVLLKVAERTKVETWFAAGRYPRLPESDYVRCVAAGSDFNGADDWIVKHVATGDLVITADIPLADRCLDGGAAVLGLRGDFFTHDNIKNALAMRGLLEELRTTGEATGGPAPFSSKQREKFINALNRFLQKKR